MQPDPPDHGPVPASSPPLRPFRHPQPTQTVQNLRQRHASPSPSRASSTLHIHVKTPHTDMGPSSGTWAVPASMTVVQAKTSIANGSAGSLWELDGMRLVWRGRILRDSEVLGIVLARDEHPTLHLVARPVLPATCAEAPAAMETPIPRAPATHAAPTAVALSDCVHYLLFAAREQLCGLLEKTPMRWEDMHPAPTVSRATARQAVMSVIKSHSQEGWEGAFAGDGADDTALYAMWETMGKVAVHAEINALWTAATGREYAAGGETFPVEVDRITYNLHIPSLDDMAPVQQLHLLLYLRITALVPRISAALALAQTPIAVPIITNPRLQPTPTPTTAPIVPAAPELSPAMRWLRLLFFPLPFPLITQVQELRISFTLVQHQFWSAVRMITIVWMLTRSLPRTDPTFWLMAGAATGWWVIDGYNVWARERRLERIRYLRRHRLRDPAAPGAAEAAPGADDEISPLDAAAMAAAEAPMHAAAARAAGLAPIDQRLLNEWLNKLPMYHLDTDARQLRLTPPTTEAMAAGAPAPPAVLQPPPRTQPGWWTTQILLPIYLWFVTLVPVFESRRARVIRQRERVIRSAVASLQPAPETEGSEGEARRSPLVLPDGLSSEARRYYLRVYARPESIDWEEEREAQRAMGIPDAEERVPML